MSCSKINCKRCGNAFPACQLLGGVCRPCLGGTQDSVYPIISKQGSTCDMTRPQLEFIRLKLLCVLENGFESKIGLDQSQIKTSLAKIATILKSYDYCQNEIWLTELKTIKNAISVNTTC